MSTKNLAGRVARPLLASIFISGGLDAARHPESKVKAAAKVTGPLSERVAILPGDPETLVRINGVVQVVAGALLSLGAFRRLAALVLIGSLVPTTIAGHRFWEELDEGTHRLQLSHFLKNLGLLGGLILVAAEANGRGGRHGPASARRDEAPANVTA